MVLPASCICSVGVIAGNCQTKSQSPLFPGAGGAMEGRELLWLYQPAVPAVWGL